MAIILVIGDDEIMNKMILQLLSESGYKAEGALNGKCGLRLLETTHYDLVITDILMPEMEGIETIRAIHRISKTLPIIAISGGGKIGPEEYLQMAQDFGVDYVFQNPFEIDRFLQAVRECLVIL